MLARIRKSKDDSDGGFTLIELLVVMIIIGILAAIAIPVFLSQRQKARDTAAKADVSTLGKELATYFVDNTTAPTNITTTGSVGAYRYSLTTAAGAVDLGKSSNGIQIVDYQATPVKVAFGTAQLLAGTTPTAWCVNVADGSQAALGTIYKYSAQNGMETGKCSSVTGP